LFKVSDTRASHSPPAAGGLGHAHRQVLVDRVEEAPVDRRRRAAQRRQAGVAAQHAAARAEHDPVDLVVAVGAQGDVEVRRDRQRHPVAVAAHQALQRQRGAVERVIERIERGREREPVEQERGGGHQQRQRQHEPGHQRTPDAGAGVELEETTQGARGGIGFGHMQARVRRASVMRQYRRGGAVAAPVRPQASSSR